MQSNLISLKDLAHKKLLLITTFVLLHVIAYNCVIFHTVSTVSLLLPVSGGELSRSRGPKARIHIAPRGAVIRIERTARVRISDPIGSHSVLPILMQLSRNTGPRAAVMKTFYSN